MRSRDASRPRAAIGPREAINNRGANQEVQFRPAAGLSDSLNMLVVGELGVSLTSTVFNSVYVGRI